MKKLNVYKIVKEQFPNYEVKKTFDGNNRVELILKETENFRLDEVVSIGIEPRTRQCKFDFLYFNIRAPFILSFSNPINGKFNYFGNETEMFLNSCIKKLKTYLENNPRI